MSDSGNGELVEHTMRVFVNLEPSTTNSGMAGTFPKQVGTVQVRVPEDFSRKPFGPIPVPVAAVAAALREVADRLVPEAPPVVQDSKHDDVDVDTQVKNLGLPSTRGGQDE